MVDYLSINTLLAIVTVAAGAMVIFQQVSAANTQKQLAEMKKKRLLILQQQEEDRKREEANTTDPKLICCFGSQTGTAEGFAKTIAEQARKYGFSSKTMDLDEFSTLEEEFSIQTEPSRIYIFVLSTYGEGDPSDNAVQFFNKLKTASAAATNTSFKFRFTVFGLGNKQYEHFNKFGRQVNDLLQQLGGTRVYAYGEGDDDGSLQEDFSKWMEDLHFTLCKNQFGEQFALEVDNKIAERPVFTQDFQWIKDNDLPNGGRFVESQRRTSNSNHVSKVDFSSRALFKTEPFPVVDIHELRGQPTELSSTLHIELQLPPSIKTYGTAFNLSILPENDPEHVRLVATSLKFSSEDLKRWFVLKPVDKNGLLLLPTPCTLQCALETCVDLSMVPTKQFVEKLAWFAQNANEQAELKRLAGKAGKEEFHTRIVARRFRLFEFLQAYESIRFDHPGQFLEMMPRLAPRDYTIASSNKVFPSTIHLVVSLVREPLVEREGVFRGVCTQALSARESTKAPPVYAFLKPSSFLLPAVPTTPIICIGPGTGVAPMRALLQERGWQRSTGIKVGPSCLFFGCRTLADDCYYREEFQTLHAQSVLTKYFVALSREPNTPKRYVQELVAEEGEWLWEWVMEQNASVFVCGGTQMGKDVHAAFHVLATKFGKMNEMQAKTFFANLSAKGRYVQELWS